MKKKKKCFKRIRDLKPGSLIMYYGKEFYVFSHELGCSIVCHPINGLYYIVSNSYVIVKIEIS